MRAAVTAAREKWADAPAHIRVMASPFVEPMLAALNAIAAAVEEGSNGKS